MSFTGKTALRWRWDLTPKTTPTLVRYCSQCRAKVRFYCSGKFRVNANKTSLDVWLIYRCSQCDNVWNCAIRKRCAARSITPTLLNAFHLNDQHIVWRYAFDIGWLTQQGAQVDARVEYLVRRHPIGQLSDSSTNVLIAMHMPYAISARLDKLLCEELQIPRSRLNALFASGAGRCLPGLKRSLRRSVKDGQQVMIDRTTFRETLLGARETKLPIC